MRAAVVKMPPRKRALTETNDNSPRTQRGAKKAKLGQNIVLTAATATQNESAVIEADTSPPSNVSTGNIQEPDIELIENERLKQIKAELEIAKKKACRRTGKAWACEKGTRRNCDRLQGNAHFKGNIQKMENYDIQ